jgi:uncharacterized membrane protein YfcA
MSLAATALLCAVMVATAFLSGVFGMAGGLVLVGVLLAMMPVPDALALHAVTQAASNGWRALLWWRHVHWRATAIFLSGAAIAMVVWSFTQYVPDKAVALLMLGGTPFLARLMPARLRPQPTKISHGVGYGMVSMSLMLLTGVSGPLLDTFFLGGGMERRQVVATKAVCQTACHTAKYVYFSSLVAVTGSVDPVLAALAVGMSMLGTSLARRVLEAMTDMHYRLWANRIITVIASYYLIQGAVLLVQPLLAATP